MFQLPSVSAAAAAIGRCYVAEQYRLNLLPAETLPSRGITVYRGWEKYRRHFLSLWELWALVFAQSRVVCCRSEIHWGLSRLCIARLLLRVSGNVKYKSTCQLNPWPSPPIFYTKRKEKKKKAVAVSAYNASTKRPTSFKKYSLFISYMLLLGVYARTLTCTHTSKRY